MVYVSNRPDFSDYLVHFTKNDPPEVTEDSLNPTNQFASHSAYDRLISILETQKILASELPWKCGQAVCLTECPWSSLLDHAKRYSPYGVGFAKPRVFAAGGGPIYYVRQEHWEKQQWHNHVKTFVTPFWPEYRSRDLKDERYLSGKTVDYSHEREWRVPHDFTFKLNQVEFVIVNTYEDMARFPRDLKDAIGRDKFLLMEIYRNIERLWPVHNLPRS